MTDSQECRCIVASVSEAVETAPNRATGTSWHYGLRLILSCYLGHCGNPFSDSFSNVFLKVKTASHEC